MGPRSVYNPAPREVQVYCMPSMHTRTKPLTAQEAFEQEGWVLVLSNRSHVVGEVAPVVANPYEHNLVPGGTPLVVIGETSENEAREFCTRVKWTTRLFKPQVRYYKAVAE